MTDSEESFGLHQTLMDDSGLGYTQTQEEDVYGFAPGNNVFSSQNEAVNYLLEEASEHDVSGVDVAVIESVLRYDLREYSSGHVDRILSILEQDSNIEPVEAAGYVRANYRKKGQPDFGSVVDGNDWQTESGFTGGFSLYDRSE